MRNPLIAAASLVLIAVMAGCSAAPAPAPVAPPSGDAGHGEVAGARELAEPALHLATVSADGEVAHLDLLDERSDVIARVEPAAEVITDGRYLFAIREGAVTVIDSGVWTWSHIDHFHYYEAPSRVIGDVKGRGVATVVPGETGTGILFDDVAVLLDSPALADGDIVERFRVDVDEHDGLVVPLAAGALVTAPDADGVPQEVRVMTAAGEESGRLPCARAAGTITTVVGVVVGCADGALLAVGGDATDTERIPYPAQAPSRAVEFAARKARPSVAATTGGSVFWVLDTRARRWTVWDAGQQIVRATAIDDADDRMLVLAADGSVLVMADGAVVARTAPLVAESLADDETAGHVRFVVDQKRAYLNGPKERTLWEIDPADAARIARVFTTDDEPLHLAGTGR
ncbi:hypothetical protein [Microbacterium sp.]|uniref:hypothetical protein n=1 Tax=Microbacterium sp. TaxID=51671 RepID=UPI002811E499|nr:hypothetical protein [Microbacterium sp.]